jgi:hypothetical protein
MQKNLHLGLLALLMGVIALSGALSGCANTSSGSTSGHPIAPASAMPDEVQEAPTVVLEAYQFAVANPDVLMQLPCYCGCGDMGHTSNYSCYVQDQMDAGEIVFDTHALGCSICVDITQDAMRLIREGKSLPEIRTYVDDTYAQYGPSNIPTK